MGLQGWVRHNRHQRLNNNQSVQDSYECTNISSLDREKGHDLNHIMITSTKITTSR